MLRNKVYQKNPNKSTYRKGYYDGYYATKIGILTLRVPWTRNGKFSTEIFESYQITEKRNREIIGLDLSSSESELKQTSIKNERVEFVKFMTIYLTKQ